jgi:hypothetical protein
MTTKSRPKAATKAASITLAAAMRDPNLLGAPFQAPTFWTWHAVAKMISGDSSNHDSRHIQSHDKATINSGSRLPTAP